MYIHFKNFRSLKKANAFCLPSRNDSWRASLQRLCCATVLKFHYSCCYSGCFLPSCRPWPLIVFAGALIRGVLWGTVCPGAPDYMGWLWGLSHLEQRQPIVFPCAAPCTILPVAISQHLPSPSSKLGELKIGPLFPTSIPSVLK